MKNKHYTALLASALLTLLLLSAHTATAGHGRQGAMDNSTLNIGITFITPGWSSQGHRAIDHRVNHVQDRHRHPVVSPRFHGYEKQHKQRRHFRKAHWRKKHHRHHRPCRPHSYYR